jgi:hypothetical protein
MGDDRRGGEDRESLDEKGQKLLGGRTIDCSTGRGKLKRVRIGIKE